MSDTPRTDAAIHGMTSMSNAQGLLRAKYQGDVVEVVSVYFARTLERELNEAKKDKERLDWLDEESPHQTYHLGWIVQSGDEESNYGLTRSANRSDPHSVRLAIDAAMKENK